MLLAGARVYYAMGRDGLFFQSVGKLSKPSSHSEAASRSTPSGCSGRGPSCSASPAATGQLLDYVIFAVLVFYILTIAGLFVLRRTQPDAPRPYRAFWLPNPFPRSIS